MRAHFRQVRLAATGAIALASRTRSPRRALDDAERPASAPPGQAAAHSLGTEPHPRAGPARSPFPIRRSSPTRSTCSTVRTHSLRRPRRRPKSSDRPSSQGMSAPTPWARPASVTGH